jgi:hypothetical protein
MPSEGTLEQPDRVAADSEAIRAGYAALSDARSRVEFAAQIRWRRSLDYDCLPAPDPPEEMYFPADLGSFKRARSTCRLLCIRRRQHPNVSEEDHRALSLYLRA